MDACERHAYHGARVAPVAQLDRVLPSEGRGRGFESRLVHHKKREKPQVNAWGFFVLGVFQLDLFVQRKLSD